MTIQLANHGGHCCGVKHIYGFNSMSPNTVVPCIDEKTLFPSFGDASYYSILYREHSPRETAENRFYRILDYCVYNYGSHLLEIQLVPEQWLYDEDEYGYGESELTPFQEDWIPIVEKCGFKEVARHINGNTGNEVITYLFAFDEATEANFLERFGSKEEVTKKEPVAPAPWVTTS